MKKISSKIAGVIICCSCIVILLLGAVSIIQGGKIVRSEAEEKLVWMARDYADKFNTELELIEDRVKEMDVYIKNTIDVDTLYNDSEYLAQYEKQLEGYLFDFALKRTDSLAAWVYFNPELSDTPHDVYFVDGDGDGIPDRQNYIPFSYYEQGPNDKDDKYWWFGAIESKKPIWSNPYEWTLKNGEIIEVVSHARPVYIKDKLIAVIGTYYHFDKMMKAVQNISVYENGYAILLNEKLDFVVNPKYFVGNRVTSDNLKIIENGKYNKVADEILDNDYGITNHKNSKIFAYSQLSNGWVMCILPQVSEIYAGVRNLAMLQILATIICVVISITVGKVMGKKITRPIRQVAEVADRVGNGDFSTKAIVNTNDEIKSVANSLNNMIDNINGLNEELISLAYYDHITGIANRNLFEKNAEEILRSSKKRFAYIILDVNKFKLVNDIFGQEKGDLLLKNIANCLKISTVDDEICARFNGDTFHGLFEYTTKDVLEQRLEKIVENILDTFTSINYEYKLSIGIGIYVIDGSNLSISNMGDKAKLALSKIKGLHGTHCYFFNDGIRNKIIEEQEIENTMEHALKNHEFKLYLQPKYGVQNHELRGAEALVRWDNPRKGLIPPDDFIPVFESNGFIENLDMYMLEQVCKTIKNWKDKGIEPLPISINQSRQYLLKPNHISAVLKVLERYDIPSSMIELEVTETAFFESEEEMIKVMENLHREGFKISMDDFGSGYSSLNMLQNIMVDVLKLDRIFFEDSVNTSRGKKIVENIISMSKELNIEIVAEGIETQDQMDFLKLTECDLVQGYYFSKPISKEDFDNLIVAAVSKTTAD